MSKTLLLHQKKQINFTTMETIQFKTNIKCSGCVANVTEELNKAAGESNWTIDLQSTDKILTILADTTTEKEILDAVQKSGYRAEKVSRIDNDLSE
jgi:copper chaperone